MIETVKSWHTKWIGDAENTPLRARIFHEVSLIGTIGLPLALLVNLFIQVPWVNLALIAAWVLVLALYITSRYFGRLQLSLILFTICMSALMAVNYYINSGIQGPTLMLYLLLLVFTLTVMPTQQFLFWMLVNVGIVGALLVFEYYRGHAIKFTYAGRRDFFFDTATTYLCVVACVGAVIFYLIYSYGQEKNKAIEASESLKAANDAKTRLLSILSHDLRSPLNSIQSYLETLREYEFSAEERQFVEHSLLSETKNMQLMLHNLLSWSKAQMTGGARVNLSRLNLFDVVADCLPVQQAAADLKSVRIHTQIDESLTLHADVDMLKVVIQNLLNNAIKFTPNGGEIWISSSSDSGTVRLHIADNGIGIPLDRQENLFTFHATSTYGTNKEKGVGLGLILCKEYTELQNGRISFRSRPGSGTEFTIEFAE